MSSKFNTDRTGTDGEEARFLAKVMLTLDGSLARLPEGVEERLGGACSAAIMQAREQSGEHSAAVRGFVAALESEEAQVPEAVKLRLDGIRARAMQRAAETTRAKGWWARWASGGLAVPVSAFASICLLVTTLAIVNLPETSETMPLLVAENSLVLASEDEIELYENLEFYQWLADNGL